MLKARQATTMVSSSSYQAGAEMKEILDRLDRMDAGFQRLEGKLVTSVQQLEGKLNTSVQRLEGKLNTSVQQLEGKLDTSVQQLEGKLNTSVQRLEGKLNTGIQRLEDKLDTGLQGLDGKFNSSLRRLEDKMDAGFQKQGVQLEALQDGVKLALEGISGNRTVLDDKFAEVLQKLDDRVQPVELASRHFARTLAAALPRARVMRKKQV